MRTPRTLLAFSLIAAPTACTSTRDAQWEELPAQSAPAQAADPMAGFARLVGGEWRVTFDSGESAHHAWVWGPGKRSLRRASYTVPAVEWRVLNRSANGAQGRGRGRPGRSRRGG